MLNTAVKCFAIKAIYYSRNKKQLVFLIKSAYFATAVIYARKMFAIFAIEIENVFLYLSIPVERV
jgi:hypothetical protein